MKTRIHATGTVAAGILLGLSLSAAPAFSQELIENGDFELPARSGGWGSYSSVPGWTIEHTFADGNEKDPLLEIWHNLKPSPYSGDQHVELDSYDPTRISQDAVTQAGKSYVLRYAWAPRPGVGDNQMEVLVDDEVVGYHTASGASGAIDWRDGTYGFMAETDMTDIAFAEVGPDDQLGMLLDAVSLKLDTDADLIPDDEDNCPYIPNPDQDDACVCDVSASLEYGQITIDTTPGHGDQDHARFKMTGLTGLGDAAAPGPVDLDFSVMTPAGIAYSFSGTGMVEGNRMSFHRVVGDGEEKITCRLSTELCVIFIERDVDIDESVLGANPFMLELEVNGTKFCHATEWAGEVFPERTVYTPGVAPSTDEPVVVVDEPVVEDPPTDEPVVEEPSVDAECPCDNDWKNHGQYMKCVVRAARTQFKAGLITKAERKSIITSSAQSDCGKK
ncbi:MAG: thrombospondin type 3 repeat-containing protein [Candidatus Electrothrix sp. YB6]